MERCTRLVVKLNACRADDKTALKAAHRDLIYDAETSPLRSSFRANRMSLPHFLQRVVIKYKYYYVLSRII